MNRIAVIGDGGWGTALASVLQLNGNDVTVWGPFEETLEQIRRAGENETYLPGVPLSPELIWTADPQRAVAGAEFAILATPTRFFRAVMEKFAGRFAPDCRFVSVAKGLDGETHETMTQVAAQVLGVDSVAALSGPSHAEEVAREVPTAVVVAAQDAGLAVEWQNLLSNPRFRVYTSDDTLGVQLGGALKNVMALAVGIGDGLGFGDNTRAALITRGLAEMTRIGTALGASPLTFAGLSGMGDLIVTCTSRHSRNRSVGQRIGEGESVPDILAGMKQVAEGVWNCRIARDLARRAGVEAPIIEQVHAVLHEGRHPHAAVEALLNREVRPE